MTGLEKQNKNLWDKNFELSKKIEALLRDAEFYKLTIEKHKQDYEKLNHEHIGLKKTLQLLTRAKI